MRASRRLHLTGVHLTGLHLIGLHLTYRYTSHRLIGMHLIGLHPLIGVHLIGYISQACISQACISQACIHSCVHLIGISLIRASHKYTLMSEVPGSIRARSCSDAEITTEVASLIHPGYPEVRQGTLVCFLRSFSMCMARWLLYMLAFPIQNICGVENGAPEPFRLVDMSSL